LEDLLGVKVDLADPDLQQWEQETHALLICLAQHDYLNVDELRRFIESMEDEHYLARSYYCKWATAMALGLIERGIIDYSELDKELLGTAKDQHIKEPKFQFGQTVQVKSENSMSRWRKPHLRTPGYIHGVIGIVESYEGHFPDPSYKAFRSLLKPKSGAVMNVEEEEHKDHLYRVIFRNQDVWPEGSVLNKEAASELDDTVTIEIYESWLVPSSNSNQDVGSTWEVDPKNIIKDSNSPTQHHHHHDHDHGDHDHDHEHLARADLEQKAVDLEEVYLCSSSSSNSNSSSGSIDTASEPTNVVGDRLSAALIKILSRPEHLGTDIHQRIRKVIDAMETLKSRADGATLVVEAWMNPEFEKRLLHDAASAALELGINTVNATAPTKLKVVKSELPSPSEPGVHNLITCTLCSCYPLSLLGMSPKWYKSRSFRARAVREPRAMLKDSFGLELSPEEWTIRVHDSTADLLYLVLPPRPVGTEGWSREKLMQLVTRDTMIGVALPDGIE
jgi:nitrile hydratase